MGSQRVGLDWTTFSFKTSTFLTNATAAAAKSLQSLSTVQPHRRQPTRLPRPWASPGMNTGVGCHFLLQCMKVKSESEVAQWCPTLCDPMDCSPPSSSIHGIFQARVLEWGAIAFSVEYYSAVKKNEITPLIAKWMDLEIIILTEESERERQIPYDATYI